MSRKRAHVPLSVKLASALAELQYLRGDPIPYVQLQAMTADQVLSLFHWDHGSLHAFTANDRFLNLTPRLILAHREKSKRDAGIVAKSKRLRRKQAAHEAKMSAKLMPVDVTGARDDGHTSRPKPKSRPMPGSRASRFKRHMDGRVTER